MRTSWNQYFMDMAISASKRSTCNRANVGAIIVDNDNSIVATGYNGSSGRAIPHCDDVGHVMRDGHCIATVHAEINAISNCAKKGKATNNCKIYVTHFPCLNCIKSLIAAGITEVIFDNDYRVDAYGLELLKANNIKITKFEIPDNTNNS